MAVGELIGAVVGLILIIVTAYILVGSTISTVEITTFAQKDMVQTQEIRLDTSIILNQTSIDSENKTLNFTVVNTGTTPIIDLKDMDVIIGDNSGNLQRFYFGGVGIMIHLPGPRQKNQSEWEVHYPEC